jgi:hypothetical protein
VDETWTLPALVAEAAARLEALPPPKNGQVRAVPDDRTIRYYSTLGLLDRPAAMRGRTALYGRRHLAQVVAIKRMQSAGKSLADIQALWPTLDDVTLSRMSGVQLPARPRGARKDFWKRDDATRGPHPRDILHGQAPRDASNSMSPQRSTLVGSASPPPEAGHTHPTAPRGPVVYPSAPHGPQVFPTQPQTPHTYAAPPQPMVMPVVPADEVRGDPRVELRIEVAPGAFVTVDVAGGVSLTSADVRALRAAAAPLVTELASRGLVDRTAGTLEEP